MTNPRPLYSTKAQETKPFKVGSICVLTTISIGLNNMDIVRYKVIEVLKKTKQLKVVKEGFSCPRYTFDMDELKVVE